MSDPSILEPIPPRQQPAMTPNEIFTYYRRNPRTGVDVPGQFLWTPTDGDIRDFDPLVIAQSPTEVIPPAPLSPPTDAKTRQAVGLLVEPSPEEIAEWDQAAVGILGLADVARKYYNGCTCGTTYVNNCAHFLSNAFILAGYAELLRSPLITAKCPHGRPIRAQDMLRWFQAKQSGFSGARVQRNTGIWATYQEKPGWQHVVVINSNAWLYYGTGDYWDWPVQWNYRIA
jgi:hypothetical protein